VTVLLSEHRLDEVLPVCTRVLFLDGGRIVLDTAPRELGGCRKALGDMAAALPACVRIGAELSGGDSPVTVKEAKQRLELSVRPKAEQKAAAPVPVPERAAVLLEDVWFRYDRKGGDALRGVSLKIPQGVFYGLVGGNGTGKSTLLSVIGGIRRPWGGKVTLLGRKLDSILSGERYRGLLGCLPQEPQNLFRHSTVRKDLEETAISRARLEELIDFFSLEPLLERHPFDLSGGEQQCAALAKVLLTEPEILLLDEPTKGLDAVFKKKLVGLLSALKQHGKTIVAASHDLDFCAECADVCALMFNGEVLSENQTRAFFTGNSFYTTAANRIARDVFPDALTCEEVIAACRNERTTG
jgi:ABC-type multidrug transport system ATPase subunit